MPGNQQTHREFERIRVQPMYTAVTASTSAQNCPLRLHGHVYDISEGGVRIELDDALDPGEIVSLYLELPGTDAAIEASASVVWVHDEQDDPGPRRMALKFTEFLNPSDRNRLVDYIDRERGRRAA